MIDERWEWMKNECDCYEGLWWWNEEHLCIAEDGNDDWCFDVVRVNERIIMCCGLRWGLCEGSGMIIYHQSHSQYNTDPKYPVRQSECGDVVRVEFGD